MIGWINTHHWVFEIALWGAAGCYWGPSLRSWYRERRMLHRLKQLDNDGHAPFGVLCSEEPDGEQLDELSDWIAHVGRHWVKTGKIEYGPHIVAGIPVEIMPYEKLERTRIRLRREHGYDE
jgi:hypothetical protein